MHVSRHHRSDLNCSRGYEWWLMEQARKRNPGIVTFALSWALPTWVGNDSYFSAESIAYHVKYLDCVATHPQIGTLDYLGVWNEKPWGNPGWIKQLRAALDGAGHTDTGLILGDNLLLPGNLLPDMASDPSFAAAVAGVGLHYPCMQHGKNADRPHPNVTTVFRKKLWSTEDSSTAAGWHGASCWGRVR